MYIVCFDQEAVSSRLAIIWYHTSTGGQMGSKNFAVGSTRMGACSQGIDVITLMETTQHIVKLGVHNWSLCHPDCFC